MASWIRVQRTTRALVDSDMFLNSASRSWFPRVSTDSHAVGHSDGKTHPLENLLLSDIAQSSIQIPDLRHDISNLVFVIALNARGFTDSHVDFKLDVSGRRTAREPTLGRRYVCGGEADAVVAGVGSREGEAALSVAALGDDAVVVVEDLIDADVKAHVRVWLVFAALLVPLGCGVVTWIREVSDHSRGQIVVKG